HAAAAARIHRESTRDFQTVQRRLGPTGGYECLSSQRNGQHCGRGAGRSGKECRQQEAKENAQRSTIPIKRGAQPLQGAAKKRVLEGWLERSGIGFTNLKLSIDFELGGTMDF